MIATVVGNFPKVEDSYEGQKLRRAIEAHQHEKISQEEVARIEDEITQKVINLQIAAGIELITDGQIRWTDQLTWPARKLSGVRLTGLIRFFDNNVYYRQPVIEKAVGWKEPMVTDDFTFAKKTAGSRAEVKAVIPGPYSLARLSKDNHYGRLSDLVHDLAKAIGEEVKALQKAGATFIQFDEPSLPYHPEDFKLAEEGLTIALAPASGIKTAVCTYFSGVSKIYSDLMHLPVDILGIDLVSDPQNILLLQKSPAAKMLALGIVDARNTKMEKEEDLRKLLASVEKNRDKIKYINPSAGLEFLPYETAVRKLELVGKLADRAVAGRSS